MQKKPHAKDAKTAKAELDEGFWIPAFAPSVSARLCPRKFLFLRALCALCVRLAFLNCMVSAKEGILKVEGRRASVGSQTQKGKGGAKSVGFRSENRSGRRPEATVPVAEKLGEHSQGNVHQGNEGNGLTLRMGIRKEAIISTAKYGEHAQADANTSTASHVGKLGDIGRGIFGKRMGSGFRVSRFGRLRRIPHWECL